MDSKQLMEKLGLTNISAPAPEVYTVRAKLSFIGGEGYVLGTKNVELVMSSSVEGFNLRFDSGLTMPASQLMGKSIRSTTVFDVRVEFPDMPMPGLSMAQMHPGVYPCVLRDHDTLQVAP